MARVGLALVAAGPGSRLGLGVPKALVEVDGVTLLERVLGTVSVLNLDAIVVAGPTEHLDRVRDIVDGVGTNATVVAGGATRTESVRAAVAALPEADVILVHDVARAWTPAELFGRVAALVAATGDGVVPVLPAVDTMVIVDGDVVSESTDRARLARVQTPQGFPGPRFRSIIANADPNLTDDATAWRDAGGIVRTVEGDERAHKVTVADDLDRASTSARVGLGTDTHAFGDAGPLWLGTLEWPNEKALSGHSDGDVVAHAMCDALLAAGGLGDIGTRFGTDDPKYAGARGDVFLRGALDLLAASGLAPRSMSVQIVGNRPKIGPRRLELEATLSAMVGAPVSVGATTTDGLGFTGEGRGLTAVAIAHVVAK